MYLEFSQVTINRQIVAAIKVLSATPLEAVQRLVDVVFSAEALSLCKVDSPDHVHLSEDGLKAIYGKVEFMLTISIYIIRKRVYFITHAVCRDNFVASKKFTRK